MSSPEQEMRDLYRDALTPELPQADCPPPDAIWDAVAMQLPADRRAAIVTHMAGCAGCAFVWQAAMAVREPPVDPLIEQPRSWLAGWRQWLRPAVLAPMAGAMAAALVMMVWLNQPALPALPAPPADGILRGVPSAAVDSAVLTHQSMAVTLAPGQRLSWPPVGDAQAYRLVLFNPDTQTITLYPDDVDGYVLEPQLDEIFAPGEQVYWYVEAIDGEQSGARSSTATFVFSTAQAEG